MIKVILVPVDGSDHSAEVLDTALVIAKRFDSHIKVVHVLSDGRIVRSGGKELALELEDKGYGWIESHADGASA